MLGTGDGERKKDPHKKSDESIDSKKKEALEIIQESKAIGHDIAILSRKYKTTAVKMSPKIMGRRFSRVKRNSCFSVIQMKIKLRQKAKDARQKNEVGREKSKFNEEEIVPEKDMICPEQKYVDANRSLTSHPKEDDKDLAHHIKQKKQKDPKGPIQTMEGSMDASSYCKEGARNLKRGFVAAALRSYHQSAATEEDWPETFIGRSRCYQLLGMPDNALKDANLAIQYRRTMGQGDPLNHHLPVSSVRFLKLGMEALQAKGQALYDLFQFEQSLISLYQAQTFRPDLAPKLNGLISKNINAIHNTLYPNCFHFDGLEKVLNNSRLRAKVQMLRNPLTKCTQQIQIAGHLRRKSVRKANGRLKSATLKKSPEPPMPDLEHLRETLVMTRHPALGDLIRDLRFLEQLSNHKDMSGLEGHVKQTLQYLEQRRQFWENFNPREVRNKSKKMSSSTI